MDSLSIQPALPPPEPPVMHPKLQALSYQINRLRSNFGVLGRVLARAAQTRSTIAAALKVTVIFLGAFVATRETVNVLLGASSTASITIFAVAGLLVAVLTGLETAFKWESRSAELRILATACQVHIWELTSQQIRIDEEYASVRLEGQDVHEKMVAAMEGFLDALETKLVQVQEKAAVLGINVAFEVEKSEKRRKLH